MTASAKRSLGFGLFIAAVALGLGMLALRGVTRADVEAGVPAAPMAIAPAARPAAAPAAQAPPAHATGSPAPDPAAAWSRAMRSLSQQTPAVLVHRAALSRSPPDLFAALAQLHRCLGKGVNQALVAHAASGASEQMKRTIRRLEELCMQRGDRQQLAYVVQSWPAGSPDRQAFEATNLQDHPAIVNYVLSTGSADFAAQFLPGHITLELLETRGLLAPFSPEAADHLGMDGLFDLAGVSRMRDQFALNWVVAIWSCNRLGTCAEEAQLDYNCHAFELCVDDLREVPERQIFRRGPVEADGSPNFQWVSRTRWRQIQQAVHQLLAGLH